LWEKLSLTETATAESEQVTPRENNKQNSFNSENNRHQNSIKERIKKQVEQRLSSQYDNMNLSIVQLSRQIFRMTTDSANRRSDEAASNIEPEWGRSISPAFGLNGDAPTFDPHELRGHNIQERVGNSRGDVGKFAIIISG